ncbi:glucose-1-phosphate thymidylyltransferase [Methanoregula sp.]|uniref:glucose-1-phosphate thymidylyltransferase n=1 Tax=Methanoregula sp. TaxID=2052170 RepID=UPI003C75EA99
MKGLILSGGHGTRLRPITYSQQKQLIPVANKPILFYCIEDLINAGIHDIAIIVGPNKEQVIETVQSVEWNAKIAFICQDLPRGLAHAVKISEDFVKTDNFIMYLGDNLLKGGSVDFIRDFADSKVDASLLLTEVEDPRQYGVALVDEQKKIIVKLVEKPKNPPSNLSIVGIYGLTPRIFEAIDNIKPSWRGELEITDALHWLIENGYNVRYGMVQGWWKDTGRTEDILEANRLILDQIGTENSGIVESGTITGQVKIGKNTIIKGNSIIIGPVIIGHDCVISGSTIGPYTSIGDSSHIIESHISDSIVMEGGRIDHVDRVSDSLIGKNVTLKKQEPSKEGKSFVLGDGSQVTL